MQDESVYSEERLANLKEEANACYADIALVSQKIKEAMQNFKELEMQFDEVSKRFVKVVKDIQNEVCKCKF